MGNVYKMCQTQVDKLNALVGNTNRCLLVAQLVETDEGEKRKVIEENISMIGDLVTLGLLKDSTDDYKDTLTNIEKVAAEEGLTPRGYLVYTISDTGNQMFGTCKKSIN